MLSFSERRVFLSALPALGLTLGLAVFAPLAVAKDPPGPKPVIQSVAVIPATHMPLTFEYSASLFVPFIARQIVNRVNANLGETNAKIINDKLTAENLDLGKQLTELVVKQLQDAGLTVELLGNVERKPGAPDNVDYTKVTHNSDAILHVYFSDLTYQSPRGQSAYWPRVSTGALVYDKTGKKYLYESTSYLDRGAKESNTGYFDAKDDLSFESQEVMIDQTAKLRTNLERVTTQAGEYLGKNILLQSR